MPMACLACMEGRCNCMREYEERKNAPPRAGDTVRLTIEGEVRYITDDEISIASKGDDWYWALPDRDLKIEVVKRKLQPLEELIDGIEAD